jgi:hypothetical protein
LALKSNNFFSEINCSKTTSYSESLLIKLSFKENRCSSPNPVEVIGIFPETFPNCTIFRFHAKNDQMTKRKYRIYKYHFAAYFMLILENKNSRISISKVIKMVPILITFEKVVVVLYCAHLILGKV